MKFLAGLAALATLAAAAPSAPTPLDIKLESAGNTEIKAIITNNGKNNLKILRAGTILDNSAIQKTSISNGSKTVRFEGIRQRVATSGLPETAFERIPAGKSIEVTFDVAHTHDLSTGGSFNIESFGVMNIAKDSSTELTGSVPFHSNKLNAKIDGNMAASARMAFHKTKRTQVQSDCTGTAKQVTDAALKGCASLARAAGEAATSGPAEKMEEFFKSSSSTVRSQVADVFAKTAAECGSTTSGASKYYCTDIQNGCEQGVLAWTLPSQSIMAYCPLYFQDLPALTKTCHAQDQATTNLHEMTHLTEVAGTEDNGYGYANIQKLTTQQSLANADSYAVFANSIYAGC